MRRYLPFIFAVLVIAGAFLMAMSPRPKSTQPVAISRPMPDLTLVGEPNSMPSDVPDTFPHLSPTERKAAKKLAKVQAAAGAQITARRTARMPVREANRLRHRTAALACYCSQYTSEP